MWAVLAGNRLCRAVGGVSANWRSFISVSPPTLQAATQLLLEGQWILHHSQSLQLLHQMPFAPCSRLGWTPSPLHAVAGKQTVAWSEATTLLSTPQQKCQHNHLVGDLRYNSGARRAG